jgi:tryptophan 2,3-dioxygenase
MKGNLSTAIFIDKLNRINAYFRNLTHSFEIMIQGMEPAQFLKFRMSLLPASGFQSAQYRLIEMSASPIGNLVHKEKREELTGKSTQEQLEAIYWKFGATELGSGKKTLTLTQFEEKYAEEFLNHALANEKTNVWELYLSMPEEAKADENLKQALKAFDKSVNIDWPLVHYKSAVRYLQKSESDIAATGGTNWQKYLPPRFQFRIFYPELYTQEEIEKWGTQH